MWKSAGRVPALWVLPWNLPYNWGKSTEKTCQGKKTLSQVKKILSQSKNPHSANSVYSAEILLAMDSGTFRNM